MIMFYQYRKTNSYELVNEYENFAAIQDDTLKEPNIRRAIRANRSAEKPQSEAYGYVWTDAPLDNVSAYKEEEKPQLQSQPADVFSREQVHDFMLASVQIFSKMMDYDSSWGDFAANCSELLNEYKTSLSAVLFTWASKGDIEKRLTAIRFHSDRKVTSVPSFIRVKAIPLSDYQDLENTIISLAKAIELIDPQIN